MDQNQTPAPAHDARFDAYLLKETGRVEIDLPNGEPMLFNGQRVVVHVFGPSSDVYADAKDALEREATKRATSMVTEALTKRKTKEVEDRDSDARFLTAVTSHIENFPFPGGHGAVYRTPGLRYIANQVRAFLNDQANFFSGSAPS